MRIAILVEGKTEKAFMVHLRRFLETRTKGHMPRLDPVPYDGRIPKGERLRREIERLLSDGPRAADAVVALTDVYTGSQEFQSAADAKAKMRQWVGDPHAAQHDFEAWLLPYWSDLQKLAGHNMALPESPPENVDHDNPPARRIKDLFLKGTRGRAYVKARDAGRVLQGKDLLIAASACPELKAFLNTLLGLAGGQLIP
jgi:hypothetical protein